MKKLFFLVVLGLAGLTVHAEELPASVLAEHSIHQAFAPPNVQGTFKLQILKTGVIRKVDNKNHVTAVAKLAPTVVKALREAIDQIQGEEFKKPKGRRCMDAPSQRIAVQQSDGTQRLVWRRAQCRDFLAVDPAASAVAEVIQGFRTAFSTIDHLDELSR